jgi:hypothetical protein
MCWPSATHVTCCCTTLGSLARSCCYVPDIIICCCCSPAGKTVMLAAARFALVSGQAMPLLQLLKGGARITEASRGSDVPLVLLLRGQHAANSSSSDAADKSSCSSSVHWTPELQDLLEKTLPKGWTSDVVAPPSAATVSSSSDLLEQKWIQPAAACTRVSDHCNRCCSCQQVVASNSGRCNVCYGRMPHSPHAHFCCSAR